MGDELEKGRKAFASQRWSDAHRYLRAALDADAPMVDDLVLLATAAHLAGHDRDSDQAWELAHRTCLDAGDLARATRCAWWLGMAHMLRGELAQGAGWIGRAFELVEQVSEAGECVEQGYVMIPAALQALGGDDPEAALSRFESARTIGRQFGDVDLATLGRLGTGQARVRLGQADAGIAALDEAMVAVVAAEVSPIVAGIVYCAVIETCQEIFDVARAREWTTALSSWCDEQPDLVPFRGRCLVHRAEIMQIDGDWDGALAEAQRACRLLSDPTGQPALAAAVYQLGELHRLRGEFEAAEDNYRRASELGREPQPGLAQLRLAQGQAEAADAGLRRVIHEGLVPEARPRLLAARVETALAVDDLASARDAVAELESMAESAEAAFVSALSAYSRGVVALAEADGRIALESLREACTVWRELGARYWVARARAAMGRCCRLVGDVDGAELEIAAARRDLEELGAAPDLERLEAMSEPTPADSWIGLTGREVEVLRLVATGDTNREIAAELVISEKTVARHVSNIFNKIGVSSRSAATAYAFRHGLA